jgi:hypothetical protein
MECESRDIVGNEILQEGQSVAPLDLKLSHMAYIEETGVCANGLMLLDNAAILYRHFPAAKLHETCAESAMLLIERGTF